MVHRFGLGVLLIFVGIIIAINALWNLILRSIIGNIAIIGDIFNAIAPDDTQNQLIQILIALIFIGIGGLLAKSHIRKQGLIS